MEGFLVVNAYTNSAHELNQPSRLREELARLGVKADIVKNSPEVLEKAGDFCVYLDKDKYYAALLERRMRLFNRAEGIEVCDDKMLTHLALDGLPMPKTIPSLLCYTPAAPVSKQLLARAEEELGYPMVIKECHGSLGQQVYLAHDRAELEELAERLKCVPHLYQQFISESAGRDLRVIVVGGRAIAAMKRSSETDFRSNAELGGRGEAYPLGGEAQALSETVAQKLRLDYCGIDLLFGKAGLLVCEVNSNAFFGTMERVTGINVAKAYAEHIFHEIYG